MSDSTEKKAGLQKTRVGIVTSDGMDKTIVVKVTRRVPHPRFKKIVKKSSKFFAHDENQEAKVGDRVLIEETKPRSKKKCWDCKPCAATRRVANPRSCHFILIYYVSSLKLETDRQEGVLSTTSK